MIEIIWSPIQIRTEISGFITKFLIGSIRRWEQHQWLDTYNWYTILVAYYALFITCTYNETNPGCPKHEFNSLHDGMKWMSLWVQRFIRHLNAFHRSLGISFRVNYFKIRTCTNETKLFSCQPITRMQNIYISRDSILPCYR